MWSTYKLSFTSPTTSNIFTYLSTSSVIRCLKSGTYNLSGSFNVKSAGFGAIDELEKYRIGLWVTSDADYKPDTTEASSAKILYEGTSSSFNEDIYIGSNQYIMLYGWYTVNESHVADPLYQCDLLIH